MANECDHTIIHLLPCHCQCNSTELLWTKEKGKIADQMKLFKFADKKNLEDIALDSKTRGKLEDSNLIYTYITRK